MTDSNEATEQGPSTEVAGRLDPIVMQRFYTLRSDLFEAIRLVLLEDSHCKSYEGRLTMSWPCYFDGPEDQGYEIHLSCYVIGPSRGYDWYGNSFSEALTKAEVDIRNWITEALSSE